ncbi:MICOS complex subunit MIC60-like [Anneissia japonica]|uniref:MICOS complex subunit MIC60-like n=1 Tax=Anneissia japonica TaxID=1529436 RepID=UPI0014257E52|nr:MICOS complex subunit MIC60-like [Anneissia japonica]
MWRTSGKIPSNIRGASKVTKSNGNAVRLKKCWFCTNPEAPLPPKKSGSQTLLKIIGGAVLVGGGAVTGTILYAKSNPEFRRQVESNWPFLNPLFDTFMYDLNEGKQNADVSFKSGPLINIDKEKYREESLMRKPEPIPEPVIPKGSPPPALKSAGESAAETSDREARRKAENEARMEEVRKKDEADRKAKELQEKIIDQEIEEAADAAAYEVIVGEAMNAALTVTNAAVESQKLLGEITKEHTDMIKSAMEDGMMEDRQGQWKDVVTAADLKVEAVKSATETTNLAREELEKLRSVIAESKKTKSQFGFGEKVIKAEEDLMKMNYELDKAIAETSSLEKEGQIYQEYRDLVEKGKTEFKKELESIMPEVKLGEKGEKMSESELNSLIAHAHRRIEQLQKQLVEQQVLEQLRLKDALLKKQQEDEEKTKEFVAAELERQRKELEIELHKKLQELDSDYEQEMRTQLKRQAAAHSDHISEVLKVQERQYEEKIKIQDVEIRADEQEKYQTELHVAMAKLRGVEKAIEGRADLEKQNKKAQELWLACETLKRTIEIGRPDGKSYEDKLKPLANEVIAVKEAGDEHPFVAAVIHTLPEEALARGVMTEDALRQRWKHVRKVCSRMSMIDETGASFYKYVLSYIQSFLVIGTRHAPELDEDVSPDSLDTFKLLDFATHYIEEGDLEQAVKFVNQLSGMPKIVASDWLKEARLLLETNQSASLLSTFATASGVAGLHL